MAVFNRRGLAMKLADDILTTLPTSAASSGLFLSAPRRTGKSTFLRQDLTPALAARGAVVLYADLWEDRRADPGDVIVAMVRRALARYEGVVRRLAHSVERVGLGAVSFSLDRVGLGERITLSAALAALSEEVERPIALIIDEAQHALTSSSGSDALFALKAARDRLNCGPLHGLRVVATGSNQDKLAMLRGNRDQAFYCAPMVRFPNLGMDYVKWFCEGAGLQAPLDPGVVLGWFEQAGFRPEILGAAADDVRRDAGVSADTVHASFAEAVERQITVSLAEQLGVVNSLDPLSGAVLRVMAAKGRAFAPFGADTFEAYGEALRALAPASALSVDMVSVARALGVLQEHALVWRSARGVYAIEESSLSEAMRRAGMLDGWPVPDEGMPDFPLYCASEVAPAVVGAA